MLRLVLVTLAIVALLWMIVPMVHDEGTEMGFAPGGPDPNVYKTTYLFGWPLTWISWERSWTEGAGYDESRIASFQSLNCVVHLLAIAVPVLLLIRSLRTGSRVASSAT